MRSVDDFVAAVRETVAPVAHLTDEEIEWGDLPRPVIELVLGLRHALREFDERE